MRATIIAVLQTRPPPRAGTDLPAPSTARPKTSILRRKVARVLEGVNDLVLIQKNLLRKKLRTVLMIVSILIAFAIFGVLTAFHRAFESGQDVAEANRLVVLNKINFTNPLPIAYFNTVRAIEGVRLVTHANWFGGYYQDPKNFLIVLAVEPETYLQITDSDFDFTPGLRQAFLRERTGPLVGEGMATKWGWKVGDRVPISSNIFSQKTGSRSWDMTIVGIFRKRKRLTDTNVMLFHYSYLNALGKT